ncbi:MAG: High-affinity branched-chain amino acid transport system permease protein LivH [Alphaproteobacteria bacterium MarineAlpha3_Bin2]|jgi:branched-chain amino acid transport system permease protein|nr:MAG: High-affinity branched-chain amino acid transport system permease protein LivH [Alphaproteobacteria bacterium MarineAlpha3_Bin2]
MLDNISLLIQAPLLNIQLLLDGLFIGAIFALAAYGLALVWGVMNVKNLAQGDFVMMGGYIAWLLSTYGIHPIFGLPVAMVIMFGFGWLIYITIICRIINRDLFTSLLATFGLALVIAQLLNLAFGPEVRVAISGFAINSFFDGMVTVANIKFIGLVLAAILAAMVISFMKLSRMGQAIRATAQDPRAAKVMGIDTERIYAFTFALNAAICGAAGALISMIWVIQPFFGIAYSIRSFVIVTAAGLGNLPGVIIAGLGLGGAELYAGFVFGAELQQFTVVGLLVVVLVVRQIQQRKHRQAVQ